MQPSMLFVWTGSLLVFGAVLVTAANALWRGRLSNATRSRRELSSNTLEPRGPSGGFGRQANWLGLGLLVLGCLMFLLAAAV
jgi:hypothetical protein